MKTVADLMRTLDPDRIGAAGAVRRMAVTLTKKALWQLAGFVIDGRTETVTAEPFTGIGVYARPPSSGSPEAIVIMVNDAKNPTVIAVRDEKTRAAIAGALKADETMLFNSKAFVHVKDDGTIEARSSGGTAVALATKADLDAVITSFNAHLHASASPGAPTSTPVTIALIDPGPPAVYGTPTAAPISPSAGTLILKAE